MPKDNPSNRFFMNGDEWGLYEVMPAENIGHCRHGIEAHREHHKDTDFALTGWTTRPYVIPPPTVSLAVRHIRVAELDSILGGVMPKASGVDSCVDYTGTPFPCPECFAFALSLENYWQCEGFYGDQGNAIVQSMYATQSLTVSQPQRPRVVAAIVELARRFDLILFAAASQIVDLRVADDVTAFIDPKVDA